MRSYFPTFHENSVVKERIGRDCECGRLSHAYIIEGADGCGKQTFAYLIAAAENCEHRGDPSYSLPCSECDSCKKILGGFSPDITLIEKPSDRANIGVEAIRALRSDMYISPNELSKKYYVIKDANTMTPQAQNALLKSLEEPPSDATLFLLCDREEALLTTIRSRAPSLRIPPLPNASVRRYLESARGASLPKADIDEIVVASNGSIGTALELSSPGALAQVKQLREDALRLARTCAVGMFDADAAECASAMPQKREKLKEVFSLAYIALRDMAALKKDPSAQLCFFTEDARSASLPYSLEKIMSALRSLERAQAALNSNANITSVLLNLLCGC